MKDFARFLSVSYVRVFVLHPPTLCVDARHGVVSATPPCEVER